jgi:hypothetical protein
VLSLASRPQIYSLQNGGWLLGFKKVQVSVENGMMVAKQNGQTVIQEQLTPQKVSKVSAA